MALIVSLPDGLARRILAYARAQGQAAETVVVEVLERSVPLDPAVESEAKSRFSFVGIGDGRSDLAENHKEIRRARPASAEDV